MRFNRKARGLVMLARPFGWPLVIFIGILFVITFKSGSHNPGLMISAILAFALTSAGGYAINDFFDIKSDTVIHPERPIPSNLLSPAEAVQFSAVMFLAALGIALTINPLAFGIVAFDIVFLLLYSGFFKRYSGFLSNIVIGLVEGITIPIFAEAAMLQTVSVVSLSFMGVALVGIGRNVLKDVTDLEGDKTMGVSTSL